MIYELPPILSGSEEQQIKELRDYLIRLVNRLNEDNSRATDGAKKEQTK